MTSCWTCGTLKNPTAACRVLKKVNFTLRRGEVHALVGENGAGKSTLIKILMGIVPKNGGTVVLDGRELKLSSPHEAAQNGIAAIFQELSLVPTLTVAENVVSLQGTDARRASDRPPPHARGDAAHSWTATAST